MTDPRAQAERFAELFRAVYLTFHRRTGPRSQLVGASRAVLEHLALAGPLTVGEAAAHMSRAQSVISGPTISSPGSGPWSTWPPSPRRTDMPAWRDHPRVIRREA